MLKPFLLVISLVASGPIELVAATDLAPGQVWNYETRASEQQSRVAIMRIETFPKVGRIIHVTVTGLRLRRTPAGPDEPWQIGHARLTEAAFRKSATKLDAAAQTPVVPGFEDAYLTWKAAADRGDLQYWHLPLRDIVQQIEKWAQKGES